MCAVFSLTVLSELDGSAEKTQNLTVICQNLSEICRNHKRYLQIIVYQFVSIKTVEK